MYINDLKPIEPNEYQKKVTSLCSKLGNDALFARWMNFLDVNLVDVGNTRYYFNSLLDVIFGKFSPKSLPIQQKRTLKRIATLYYRLKILRYEK